MNGYLYIYNKNGAPLLSGLYIPAGNTQSYTVDYYAPDTIYILMYYGGGYGIYGITYDQTPETWPEDVEPNNTFAEANSLARGDTAVGQMGFQSASTPLDAYDYYKGFVPVEGQLTVSLNTEGLSAYLYVYNSAGVTLLSGLWTPAGSTQEYTLDCLGTDSVYILVYYGGGCGTYKVSINTELLSDGLYMIELERDGWKEIRPVIIQH